MARTPKRLAGPAQLTGSAATQYTVPAATKAVIRHIHVQNPSASAVDVTISIGTDAAAKRLYDGFSVAADAELDRHCYYVLEATEILQAFASTTGVLVLTVTGHEEPA